MIFYSTKFFRNLEDQLSFRKNQNISTNVHTLSSILQSIAVFKFFKYLLMNVQILPRKKVQILVTTNKIIMQVSYLFS